jgi:hypothetical protein
MMRSEACSKECRLMMGARRVRKRQNEKENEELELAGWP